jgi:5-methylcytosine-specific restriction protein A
MLSHQSTYWKKRASAWLRLNPLCICCKAIGRTIAAAIVDHVVPVWAGGDWRGPIQSCCRRCHDSVKRKLEALYKAGKATADDLRLDSKLAQELARKEYMRTGVDGWPVLDLMP